MPSPHFISHQKMTQTLSYRMFEIIIPLISWSVILMPIWLSPFQPSIVAFLILLFFLYSFYKSLRIIYFSFLSFRLMERATKTDWNLMLDSLSDTNKSHIHHFFVMTNYKEEMHIITPAIQALADQDFDKNRLHLVLAMEKREGEGAIDRANELTNIFKDRFDEIITTYHPIIKGEIVGKASNEAYATRVIYEMTQKKGLDPKHCLITVLDADSLLPKNYTPYLTYKYLTEEKNEYKFFWGPVLLYNNFWKLTLPVRVQSIISSVIRLSLLTQKEDLIHISTYSTNLWLLEQVEFWDVDIIPEDWHLFLQAFFTFGSDVKTIPLFTPINGDPVHTNSMWTTFKNRYEQEKRWAWGVTDIPYSIARAFQARHIPWGPKIRKIALLSEIHLFWPTSFFLLFFGAYLPSVVNPNFARTSLGFLLPQISSVIMTLSSLLLLIFIFFDFRLRHRVNIKTEIRHLPLLFIQWYFLPLISFVFSSLPALEAHTRLLLGKKIEYKVTEKA